MTLEDRLRCAQEVVDEYEKRFDDFIQSDAPLWMGTGIYTTLKHHRHVVKCIRADLGLPSEETE